ncbi:MAG: response regulator [Nitrospiraceae bacterium]|nr:response regulator [Nitrospiraceae bacterium]
MVEGRKILIIDDSATVRKYLKWLFTNYDNEVDTAETGTDGLRRWKEGQYDIILIDLFLPDVDGLSLVKEIRNKDQKTCLVMLTGHGDLSVAVDAIQHGADAYIEKQQITIGADPSEFMAQIGKSLQKRLARVV